MSNSSLVSYVALSPNHSGRRRHEIDTITPHYMGGNCTVEVCGQIFAPTSRQASSNYGIGSDGRVGMYVEERNRAWTSGNGANDNRAVTIECANFADGSLSNGCWRSLVALCADICERNGKTRLVYRGSADYSGLADTDMLLTMHRWFQSTDCPGPWLSNQFGRLAEEVNARLNGKETTPEELIMNGMACILEAKGKGYKVYFDGSKVHGIGTSDEYDCLTQVWKANNGTKMPEHVVAESLINNIKAVCAR